MLLRAFQTITDIGVVISTQAVQLSMVTLSAASSSFPTVILPLQATRSE
jgi:hypothetical protein